MAATAAAAARPESDTFYIAFYVKANDVGRLATPAGAKKKKRKEKNECKIK